MGFGEDTGFRAQVGKPTTSLGAGRPAGDYGHAGRGNSHDGGREFSRSKTRAKKGPARGSPVYDCGVGAVQISFGAVDSGDVAKPPCRASVVRLASDC